MAEPRELEARDRLAAVGLRPTKQRIGLAALLFAGGPRHVTAETLHAEAGRAGATVSLATVYNTLRAFTQSGLVRQVAVDGSRVYFDTNVEEHHHFFDEQSGVLRDIDAREILVDGVPEPPEGCEIASVDVIVRVRPKR